MENALNISPSLLGGILIGVCVTAMLLFNGRVTGISGILSASLIKPNAENAWRLLFLAGLLLGGFVMREIQPDLFLNDSGRSVPVVLIAGLFVGYGTVMGGGCTSGHGICGLSRLSIRSIVATIVFMLFGFFAVQGARLLLGNPL